jgi:hypothetical protein
VNIREVYREVNSQIDKDTFDNRIILTLAEWNCIKETIRYHEDRRDDVLVESGNRWIKLSKIKQILEEE